MSEKTPMLATKHHKLGRPGGPGLFRDKNLQLPAYIQNIARALIRQGKPKSQAIQLALGAVERWKNGGDNVSPEVRAAAATAWAQWEAAKAKARATPNKRSDHANDAAAVNLAWDSAAHPRAEAGSATGGQFVAVGQARDSKAAESQKDVGAQDLYRRMLEGKLTLKDLSDADLQKLSRILYSFKTSNEQVVKARIAVANELDRRGMDVKDHGALGGGRKKTATLSRLRAELRALAGGEIELAAADAVGLARDLALASARVAEANAVELAQEHSGTTTTQILSPIDLGQTSKVGGRLWRKQILPIGSINYKGRKIDFTRDKLAAMADAFRAGAFDSVPLVMADHENRHTMDPRHTTGEMVDVELTSDGLVGVFRASEEAAKLLESYPRVGISARILENYERADGQRFPAAIQHALITSDPRITGMRPWEAVQLSAEVEGDVLDLTAETFASQGEQEGDHAMSQPFTDDELSKLRALLDRLQPDEDTSKPDDTDEPGDEIPELTEDELNALAEQVLADEQPADAPESAPTEEQPEPETAQVEEPQQVAASNDAPATELSNARVGELEIQLSNLQRELDARNYESERDRLASEFGIPPAVTDLARPLLEGHQVIELSNGSSVDAGQVVREVFAAMGRHVKLLDLSSSAGSAFETDEEKAAEEERTQWVNGAMKSLGLS